MRTFLPVRGAWINSLLPIYMPTWVTRLPPLVAKKTRSPGRSFDLATHLPAWYWLRDTRGAAVIKEASMVKLLCTEMACRVADRAVQIHGGMGYMKGTPVERYYRDLRLNRIFEGTSEIERLVIARELLQDGGRS